MKTLNLFLFSIFLVSISSYAQKKDKHYSVSGKVQVLVGSDIVSVSEELVIEVKNTRRIVFSNSVGEFYIDSLKNGEYNLQVRGFAYILDTAIVIKNKSINLNILATADCDVNKIVAERNIKENKVKLLLFGSIAPRANTYFDKKFEQEYNIEYYDYGCTPPAIECVIQYNETIFKYLDTKFGLEWRTEVRDDVVGLNNKEKAH